MDTSSPSDNTDEPIPLEDTDTATVTDGTHVLNCRVDGVREYQQRYDPHTNKFLSGPASHETPPSPYTEYDCSCGAHFTTQSDAQAHLLQAQNKTPE